MSAITGKPTLDIHKFDKWLHEKYGNYEDTGHFMQTLLAKYYGQENLTETYSRIDKYEGNGIVQSVCQDARP